VEQAHDLPSYNGHDLLAGLEELHARVARVEDECVGEAMKLSRLVMGVPDALVDLGVFNIWDIPQCPQSAQEVLAAAGLILERLREEHASDASP
jgi:hypothetical protein